MLTVLILGVLAAAALALAVLLLQSGKPQKQLEQRLKIAALEYAPSESEATDVRKQEALSKIGWLNWVLSKLDLAARLRLLLYQADVNWSVATLLAISIFGWMGAGCLLYLRLWSFWPSLALAALFVPLPLLYVLRRRAKRFARFEVQLPEGLTLLVSALRVGHSFMTAIGYLGQESAEPLGGEFRQCFEEQNYGVELRQAMLNLARRVPLQDLRIFIASVLIHKETGGNLAEVLEKVAETIRERFRLKKQVRVHSAQGRATGWILSLLPVVLGAALYLVRPEGISLLWTRPVGLKLLYTAAAMNLTGALLIRKIVRIRV